MKLRPSKPTLVMPTGEPVRRPSVALGYPSGGNFTSGFMESLLRLREYEVSLMAEGIAPLVRHRLPQIGLYIGSNRNRIAAKFMKDTDADWLMQIDSDIEFPPTIVETLIERAGRDKKIIAASVPLGMPFPSCAWMRAEAPGVWSPLPSHLVTEEPIQCDGLATAVILIHREVLAAIAERFGQSWFLHINIPQGEAATMAQQEYISQGEDLAFCDRAAAVGYSMWCTRVDGLRHYKQIPMSHDFERPMDEASADISAEQQA